MAGTLPNFGPPCCDPCESPVTTAVPGPKGDTGNNGTNGAAGPAAYTTFGANFTMPAEGASAVATVGSTAWMAVDQVLFGAKSDGSVRGNLQVMAIGGPTAVTLKNLKNTGTGAYLDNSAPGSVFTAGSQLTAGGVQGPAGTVAGTAVGGDLKGTLVNPKISVANTKGSIPVGNGTDTTAVPVGTDGFMISADATAGNGVKWAKDLPVTGDTAAATDRVARLSAGSGLPIPLKPSYFQIKDPTSAGGTVVADMSSGNARGTDAIDLQTSKNAVTQVAGGQESVISGGRRNTASGTRAVVAGGDTNVASGKESVVAGGTNNQALTNDQATVGGGDSNTASGEESTVSGGKSNTASGTQSSIGGGDTNQATAAEATVAGGGSNVASGIDSAIGGGTGNTASGQNATVGGGASNAATGDASVIPGGFGAVAPLYCERAHAAGPIAANGDAQLSEIIWLASTTNATATEAFLGLGTGNRAVLANNTTWGFQGYMTVRKSDGSSALLKFEGLIKRGANAAATTLVGVTNTSLQDESGATWGAVGAFAFTADVANGSLKLAVTGVAATNLHWMAVGRLYKLG